MIVPPMAATTTWSSVRSAIFSASAVLTLWVGAQAPLVAVEPALGNISPAGLQRGVETEVVFNGNRLTDVQEVLFYSPGVTVQSIAADGENKAKAKLVVAPDCRLGIHAVRLRTASGVSNLKTFMVGHLPEAKEVEPNNNFAEPQAIGLNVTIAGTVDNEDVDYFGVDLKKGERLTVEVEGLRLGNSQFDPYVGILNAARFELARSDDAPLLSQDSLCSLVAPEDGRYVVQIRETSYRGTGAYRMHLGTFPRPTAVYPAGGKPGETLQVRWIGDAGGEWTTQVTLPTASDDDAGLVAQDDRGLAPSPNPIRVVDLQNYLEAEPNDTWQQASPGAANAALNGIIEKEKDEDHFKFAAKKGEQYDIRVYARKPLRSPLDPVLSIYNAKGGRLAQNDDSGGPDAYLRFGVPEDGDYIVGVEDHLKSGGPGFVYRVEIEPVKPALTMGLPERQQYVATTLAVPKGNRMALMVSAQRANFGSDLSVEVQGLPPGMAFETVPMPGARGDVPVLFTAAAEAAPAGSLANLVGRSTDPAVPVEGHLKQRSMLIRGRNNSDVWGHDEYRMAAVLTDEIPFKIDLVPPKAPLVRNGSLNIKVVATRKEGFTAPITLGFIYNPPGVSSSGNVTIPEGQTEATIPMTANGTAAIGVWKMVAVGSAPHAGAKVEAATQFIDLNISEQFFKLALDKSAVEQGQTTEMLVKVEKLQDFAGNVKAELAGLPPGATTEPAEFNKDTTELVFKIVAAKDARVGKHTSVVAVATLPYEGDVVTHTLGPGELRIDAPLPPKVDATPIPAPQVAAAPPAPVEKKRLSRLEQLRQQREQEMK
jgi:hypothetical protein